MIFPLLLVVLLGIIEVGLFLNVRQVSQNSIGVIVAIAAFEPTTSEWRSKVADENERSGCHASPLQPTVVYPDGDDQPGDRLRMTWHCHYQSLIGTATIAPDGISYTVTAEAVIGGPIVVPASPSP